MISGEPSPLRPAEVEGHTGNHYILNIDNQQLRETSPLNVVRQVMPQGVQSNTAAL